MDVGIKAMQNTQAFPTRLPSSVSGGGSGKKSNGSPRPILTRVEKKILGHEDVRGRMSERLRYLDFSKRSSADGGLKVLSMDEEERRVSSTDLKSMARVKNVNEEEDALDLNQTSKLSWPEAQDSIFSIPMVSDHHHHEDGRRNSSLPLQPTVRD